MAILTFMSDEHLWKCIEKLYIGYTEAKKELTIEDFYKNRLDPLKFYFDMEFNNIGIEEYINVEAKRKADKTISNLIGEFHQELFNGIEGYEAPTGSGYDIKKLDNTIFAELKNKHNTMNSGGKEAVFQKLTRFADAYPECTCYLVEVIALRSKDILWKGTFNGTYYEHERIRQISVDKFYELITGRSNAFFELCQAIQTLTPDVIAHFESIKSTKGNVMTTNKVYEHIQTKANNNSLTELEQIFKDNLIDYNNF